MFDRRQFFQFAAATAGLAASGFPAPAFAQQGLKMGEPAPFSYEGLKSRRATWRRCPMCRRRAPRRKFSRRSITTPTARSSSRPTWPCGPTARASSPLHSSILGGISRSPRGCTWWKRGRRARSSTTTPISTCPPIRPLAGSPTIRASPVSASRRPATASLTGTRTIGWPSSAHPISALSASSTNMASRPGAWRWTSRSSANPRNSRISRTSSSKRRRRNPIPSRCTRFSMDRALRALIASSCSVRNR